MTPQGNSQLALARPDEGVRAYVVASRLSITRGIGDGQFYPGNVALALFQLEMGIFLADLI